MKLGWLALALELSPLLAFCMLAVLHPVGDPQSSHSLFIRLLDYQGTYWMRQGLPVPPPLLVAGLLLSAFSWWRRRAPVAQAGVVVGLVLLALWLAVMAVPLLVHVN